jgi:predicted XRE-type DNA-binding protein
VPRARGPNLARSPIVREVVELIDKSGWADWQVAEVAGVSLPYISQLRGGRRHEVSATCLEALLGVFGRKLTIGPMKQGKGRPAHRARPARDTKRKQPRRATYAGKDDEE